MNIYGLQKLTLLDFPDRTACTLFTGGCDYRCPFCQNASLVFKEDEVLDTDAVMKYLDKRRGVLDGVCVTGGEPLMNPDIGELIKNIRVLGYAVKLDTNGSYPDRLAALIDAGLIDYVAMDIKSSKEGYPAATGVPDCDTAKVSESVEMLLHGPIDYEFRTTAVRGIHCLADFYGIGSWIAGAKRYFIQNFSASGDILSGTGRCAPFERAELEGFLAAVSPKVEYAALRGID